MRLIDADELGVGRCSEDVFPSAYCNGWNGLIQIIENAEVVDAVPVIRCRDCINYNERRQFCEFSYMKMQENGFCSYGERREE